MSPQPTKQKKSLWLVSAIKYGLFVCLFMPLVMHGAFIFPYIFPKQAFFQIIAEVLFGLYLYLALRQPQYRPRSSNLLRLLFAYFCVLVLSSVFGQNFYHSLWSNYERMAGVINLLHYLGFLFIAVNVFKTKEDWRQFFDFSIFAGAIEALYVLSQLAGLSSSAEQGATRFDGTIGNPSFLAGYMLINALFAFWLLLEKKRTGWRVFYGAAILLNMLVLYQTQTRGAMVALVLGLVALACFLIFAPRRGLAQLPFGEPVKLKKYAVAALAIIFLAAVLIFVFRDSQFMRNRPTLSRLAHISFKEATAQTRLLAWQMSLEGFKEHPIFGWGPENYYILFNKYYDPELYPQESWFDRSHNAYLDVLVNTGVVGFSVYIAIPVLAFWYLWRGWRREQINYQTAVIFSVILLAYGAQNIFVFDTQVTLLMIFSILAFIVFLGLKPEEKERAGPVPVNLFFALVLSLAILTTCYFVNIKPALASAKGIDALMSLQKSDLSGALNQFREAYKIGTFGLPEVAMRVNELALKGLNSANISDASKKEIVELAAEGMKKALELEPQNVRFMMMLGTTYLAASQLDISYLNEANLLLEKALELSPTRQELYFSLGQLRMFQGRTGEVLPLFKKAAELNPKVGVSHWNYGVMAIALGEKELGESEIRKARDWGHPYGPSDIKFLINAYGKISDWQKIISLYQDWVALTPNDAAPYAGLAAVCAQTGDKQKAKDYALQAAEIDPAFEAEAEQFIKGLGL